MCNVLDKPHTILDALIYFTNCQIATYLWFATRKTSPKNELKRNRHFAELMIKECQAWYAPEDKVAALSWLLHDADELCYAAHGIRNP